MMMMMTAPVIVLLSTIGSIQSVQNTTQFDRDHDNLQSNGSLPISRPAVSPRPLLLVPREISHNSTTTALTYTEIFTTLASNIISSTGKKQSTRFSDRLKIFLCVGICVILLPFGWILILHYTKNRNAKKSTQPKSRSRRSRRMDNDYEKYPLDHQHDLTVTSTNLSELPHSQPDLICDDKTDADYEKPDFSEILSDQVYQTLDISSRSDSIYHVLKPKTQV